MAGKKDLSTFDVAQMLGVDPGSVANWIDQGRLRAYRTPGGHRRVAAADLLAFLKGHNMPIPRELADRPVRVVVVDDQPPMTQMIAKAIKRAHPECEVVEAHDGFQAGAVIATLRPDVVILDIRMPGMDGFEVCRMIKGHAATRHAKVVAVTAFPSEEAEASILACGASLLLPKPLNLPRLVGEVSVFTEPIG